MLYQGKTTEKHLPLPSSISTKSHWSNLTSRGSRKIGGLEQVSKILHHRLIFQLFSAADRDIGVIAPYHAQCLKLKTSLQSIAESVKVGSVEEFQGQVCHSSSILEALIDVSSILHQERKVIIISTVHSSKAFVEYDLRHTLGFVANPRRFNGNFDIFSISTNL